MTEDREPAGDDNPVSDSEELVEAAEEMAEAVEETATAARDRAREQARAAAARVRERTARPREAAGNIFSALKETASDMLSEARRGAAEAQDEMWARYEAKTKHRRKSDDD